MKTSAASCWDENFSGELLVEELDDEFLLLLSRRFTQLQDLVVVAGQRHELSDTGVALAAPYLKRLQRVCFVEMGYTREGEDSFFHPLGAITFASAAVFANIPSVRHVAFGLPAEDHETKANAEHLLEHHLPADQRCKVNLWCGYVDWGSTTDSIFV